MKLNSPDSSRLAQEMFEQSGGRWDLVREAGKLREDGIVVVSLKSLKELRDKQEGNGKAARKR
jgi:hypothetical protein